MMYRYESVGLVVLNLCSLRCSFMCSIFLDVWRKIFDRVAKLRLQHDVVRLHSLLLFGEEFFGLSDATVIRIVESVCSWQSLLCDSLFSLIRMMTTAVFIRIARNLIRIQRK